MNLSIDKRDIFSDLVFKKAFSRMSLFSQASIYGLKKRAVRHQIHPVCIFNYMYFFLRAFKWFFIKKQIKKWYQTSASFHLHFQQHIFLSHASILPFSLVKRISRLSNSFPLHVKRNSAFSMHWSDNRCG